MSDGIADLLVRDAKLVAVCDGAGRELPGGWVAITAGVITGVGAAADPAPEAATTLDASGCLVTPGLINTHHHIYQNLTRSYGPAINGPLFSWLTVLYPLWARIDEEAAYLSAWVGLAELALGGCTTTTDHLYVAPRGGGDLWSAEIAAARELGMRFHPTRGSMTLSVKDGGLPPDSVVQDDDEVLADSERLVKLHHDPSFGAMVRVALAPCSPFSVSPALMRRTAELAERLDVRLHTHLAEDPDEDTYCLERFGRRPGRAVRGGRLADLPRLGGALHLPVARGGDPARRGRRRGRALPELQHAHRRGRLRPGPGVAGGRARRSASAATGPPRTDSASLWIESRAALLLGSQRLGPDRMTAREVLDIATRGGAACLGRTGEIGELSRRRGRRPGVLAAGRRAVRRRAHRPGRGVAALRAGVSARHTVVAGQVLVRDGELTVPGADIEDRLRRHAAASARVQGLASGGSGQRR